MIIKDIGLKKILIILIFFFLYHISLAFVGLKIYKSGQLTIIKNDIKNLFSDKFQKKEQLPNISIDIKKNELYKLEFTSLEAIKNKSLKFVKNDYQNAKLIYEDKLIGIDIKLKGSSATEHFGKSKKSYQVKLKNGIFIKGMNRFSFMSPARRNFLHEWVIRKMMMQEDIITKKYLFKNLYINNDDMGVYVLDEEITKYLLERHGYREGPIMRFDNFPFWNNGIAFLNPKDLAWTDFFYSADLKIVNENLNEKIINQFNYSKNLFNKFRSGEIKASGIFDIEKMASFYAISTLMKGGHGAYASNMFFYFNPITSLIEPIQDDSYSEPVNFRVDPKEFSQSYLFDEMAKKIFEDEQFLILFFEKLKEYSKESYINEFYNSIHQEFEYLNNVLRDNYDNDKSKGRNKAELKYFANIEEYLFDEKLLHKYANYITNKLEPDSILNSKIYFSNMHKEKNLIIKLYDKSLPLILNGIFDKNNNKIYDFNEKLIFPKISYAKSRENLSIKLNNKELNNFSQDDDYYLRYKVLNSQIERKDLIEFEKDIFIDIEKNLKSESNEHLFKINNKNIIFNYGYHKIKKYIFIPRGYNVYINKGTHLVFENNSSFLSNSPINLLGSPEENIIIEFIEKSGGFYLFNSSKESNVMYTIFQGLSSKNNFNKFLTGGLTIYRSNFKILNSEIVDSKSEDALNVVNSSFFIDGLIVKNSFSDSIDIDFSNGKILNTKIYDSANDGIDFSGSNVEMKEFKISNSGDKAISVGEKSLINAENIKIDKATVAVASKDSSLIFLNNIDINNSIYGLVAYKKKEEYEGGQITANNILFEFVEEKFKFDSNSSIYYEK